MAIYTLEKLSSLLDDFRLDELKNFRKHHLAKFVTTHRKQLEAEGIPKKWLDMVTVNKNLLKAHVQIICSIPFATKSTYFLFLESLPRELRIVFEALLTRSIINENVIKAETNISIVEEVEERNAYYGRVYKAKKLLTPFASFLFDVRVSSDWSPSERKYWLGVPLSLKLFLLEQYYEVPENAKLIPQEDQNPEGPMLFSQKAAEVLSDVGSIKVFALQGGITIGARGKVSVASVKKAQRQLNIEEFFPDTDVKTLTNLRTTFLMCIASFMRNSDLHLSNHELLRKLLHDYLNKEEPVINLLSYFKGMGTARLQDYIDPSAPGELIKVLKKLPQDSWVSTSNILKHIQYFHIDTTPIATGAAVEYLSLNRESEKEPWYVDEPIYISYENYEDLVAKPFVKGMLFFFAAAGVLDICYRRPVNTHQIGMTYHSPYDELFSVRLTDLGAYLLRITEEYTPPESKSKTKLQFVETALVITADREDEIVNLLLEPFTTRIGPTRFIADFSTFLRDCKSRKDIRNKIDLFRNTVQRELPPIWEAFFEEVEGKIDPFDKVNSQFTVYRIPPENKALAQLIARDEQLKSFVLKAEGFHILVPVTHSNHFKKRLAEFGYMLT